MKSASGQFRRRVYSADGVPSLSEGSQEFSQAQAYEVVLNEVLKNDLPIAGWKIGGTNKPSQLAFGASSLFFGPLLSTQVFSYPVTKILPPVEKKRIEVEIAVRINVRSNSITEWTLALEFPQLTGDPTSDLSLPMLIADHCGAGALYVGRSRNPSELVSARTSEIALSVNGEALERFSIRNLTTVPEAIAQEFLSLTRKIGFKVDSSHWIATGGMSSLFDIEKDSIIEVFIDGIPELSLRV